MNPAEDCIDLASELLGGMALAASDQFFAPKENLVKAAPPVFIPDKYTELGKWMDGWETRRWRPPRLSPQCETETVADEQNLTNFRIIQDYLGEPRFDWCVIRLGLSGILRGVDIDTSYFIGNAPSHASVESCSAPDGDWQHGEWRLVLPKVLLQAGSHNIFDIHSGERSTHLRLNIFPDGGVARLRAYGEVAPDLEALARSAEPADFASVTNGGRVLVASDMHFGSKHNLIMPGRPVNMGGGWETRRRRGPGYDWIIVRLGTRCSIERISVETEHFKGNYPDGCSLDACDVVAPALEDLTAGRVGWQEILAPSKLCPDAVRVYENELIGHGPFTHLRLNIYPDGGISRLRAFGRVA